MLFLVVALHFYLESFKFYLNNLMLHTVQFWTSQVAPVVKNPPASEGGLRDLGSFPGSGSSPGGGHGTPLQSSCLENPWTEEPGGLVHGVTESDTTE